MPRYMSKVRLERKVFFFIFLCVYVLGFVSLYLIGEQANHNPYHPLMFLAPLLIFTGFFGMFCSLIFTFPLFFKKKKLKNKN